MKQSAASLSERSWINYRLLIVYYFKEDKHEFGDLYFSISAGLWFELDLGPE